MWITHSPPRRRLPRGRAPRAALSGEPVRIGQVQTPDRGRLKGRCKVEPSRDPQLVKALCKRRERLIPGQKERVVQDQNLSHPELREACKDRDNAPGQSRRHAFKPTSGGTRTCRQNNNRLNRSAPVTGAWFIKILTANEAGTWGTSSGVLLRTHL